jgi:protein TonB
MRPAYAAPSSYVNRPTLGSRASSFAIALALVAALIWMLLRLGLLPDTLPSKPPGSLTTIDVQGDKPSHSAQKAVQAAPAHKTVQPTETKPTPKTPPPVVPPPPIPWNVIPMSHDDFVQSDISTKPNRAADKAAAGGQQADGSGAGDDNGSGGGGPGDRLYNAEWYPHPPTQQEMDFYLPKNGLRMPGWGEIACRTVANYRVEDCKEIGDTPGSGFARSMVNAAWQFRVMPPRVNGRPMVGAWVRIHYDFYIKNQ